MRTEVTVDLEQVNEGRVFECPFCDATPIVEHRTTKHADGYGVCCPECSANNWEEEEPYTTPEEAVDMWNRRTWNAPSLRRKKAQLTNEWGSEYDVTNYDRA